MNNVSAQEQTISVFIGNITFKELNKKTRSKELPKSLYKENVSIFRYEQNSSFLESAMKSGSKPLVIAISEEEQLNCVNKVATCLDSNKEDILIMWCGTKNLPKQRKIPVFHIDQIHFYENYNWKTLCDEARLAKETLNLIAVFK